jgi:sigma-E factor negative regulatory protein RseB
MKSYLFSSTKHLPVSTTRGVPRARLVGFICPLLCAGISLNAAAQAGMNASPNATGTPPHLLNYFGPPQTEVALEWLDRIGKSARELPYAGVFVHQTADKSSTSRVTHLVDKSGVEHEKVESLDGPVTEIIRRDDQMICYQPDSKTIRVDRRATGRFFPALITRSAKEISENYRVKLGQIERIAGFDCQWVILEPKDAMRYMQKLCAEMGTGLLLRAKLFNERNQLVEQFMFTQLDVSKSVARQSMKSRFEQATGWLKEFAVQSNKDIETGWQAANLPSGFRKVMEMTRTLVGRPVPVSHLVYSDGASNVSVFVENSPMPPNTISAVAAEEGPTSFAMRAVNDTQVTVMGEVPLAAVQAIADGVRRR